MRHAFVFVHRYAGLSMALFLVIAGLTGSIMAFEDEIDAWLNPQLFSVASRGDALSPTQLAERIERQDVRFRVSYMPIVLAPGKSVNVSVRSNTDPATGKPYKLEFNQLFADPVTGSVLGTRRTGTMQFDRVHFIPFIVKLHYSLFLPGSWGLWLFGAVALVWTMDCFIGLFLTLPRGRPFLEKWQPAWEIKRKRFNFDLHRAGSLWTWLVLLILAVSSVSLNLYGQVFKPVVSWFSPMTPTPFDTRPARTEAPSPAFDFDHALMLARVAGEERGIDEPVGAIGHRPERGFYFVSYRNTDGKTESGLSNARLYIDDQTGAVIGERGTGKDTAGDFFAQIQYPLHSGRIAGVMGRAFIFAMGLLISALSLTGIIIWLRKRRARVSSRTRVRMPARPDPGHAYVGRASAGRQIQT
jgi:uncharacterized iron-regulated membrane protein